MKYSNFQCALIAKIAQLDLLLCSLFNKHHSTVSFLASPKEMSLATIGGLLFFF